MNELMNPLIRGTDPGIWILVRTKMWRILNTALKHAYRVLLEVKLSSRQLSSYEANMVKDDTVLFNVRIIYVKINIWTVEYQKLANCRLLLLIWPFIVHREKLVQYGDVPSYNFMYNFARLAVRISTHTVRTKM